jgi:hypothetical protein
MRFAMSPSYIQVVKQTFLHTRTTLLGNGTNSGLESRLVSHERKPKEITLAFIFTVILVGMQTLSTQAYDEIAPSRKTAMTAGQLTPERMEVIHQLFQGCTGTWSSIPKGVRERKASLNGHDTALINFYEKMIAERLRRQRL